MPCLLLKSDSRRTDLVAGLNPLSPAAPAGASASSTTEAAAERSAAASEPTAAAEAAEASAAEAAEAAPAATTAATEDGADDAADDRAADVAPPVRAAAHRERLSADDDGSAPTGALRDVEVPPRAPVRFIRERRGALRLVHGGCRIMIP